ncbi:hypothetical protein H4S08_001284 [Coemansia sp. RSA 1365]|nr:hypothetical protein H4S08_001284 [Coemansia sp. RSA 1365]
MATVRDFLNGFNEGKWLRITHMLLNAVAATAGIFFLIAGIADLYNVYEVFGGKTLPILYILIGGLVTFISLVGIIGSAKESQYIFGTYSGLLALLVIIQIIGLMVIWLRPLDIEDKFSNVWEKLYEDDQDTIKYIEKDLKCCGFKSPVDMPVPAHCSVKKHYGFTTGCLEPLEHQWNTRRQSILWVGFAMVSAQIVALLMGAELVRRFRRTREGYQRVPGQAEGSPLLRG